MSVLVYSDKPACPAVLRGIVMRRALAVITCLSLYVTLIAGCATDVRVGTNPPSRVEEPRPHVAHARGHGPPDHAPAHGFRRKYEYSYYPSSKVYYDRDRGLYFWIRGDGWEVGAKLPDHFVLNEDESVTVVLDRSTPATSDPATQPSNRGRGRGRRDR